MKDERMDSRIEWFLIQRWSGATHFPFLNREFRRELSRVFGIPENFGENEADRHDAETQSRVSSALSRVYGDKRVWRLFCRWVRYPSAHRNKPQRGGIFLDGCGLYSAAAGMRNAIKNGRKGGFSCSSFNQEEQERLENVVMLSARAAVKYAPMYDEGCGYCKAHMMELLGYGFHQRY